MCFGHEEENENIQIEFRKISDFDTPIQSSENMIRDLNRQINTLRIYSDLWECELDDGESVSKLRETANRLENKRNRLKKKYRGK